MFNDNEADLGYSDINDFDNTVTVLVCRGEKRFTLHQDVVCAKSKFFKAACSKRWIEGRLVRLPEMATSTCKAYCGWVYSGKIAEIICNEDSDNDDKCNEKLRFVDLYLAADTLDDIQLRNLAVGLLFKCFRMHATIPSDVLVDQIWKSTLRGSQMRRMILDSFVAQCDRKLFEENLSKYPREFIEDVATTAMKAAPAVSWSEMAKRISDYDEVEKAD